MSWWRRLWLRKKMEKELEKELRFHLDQHAADLIAQGLDPEEARRWRSSSQRSAFTASSRMQSVSARTRSAFAWP